MPKAAPGSEVLDLSEFTAAAGGLREGGSLVEFLKDGTKSRRLFEAAENLTESIEKVQEGLESYEKGELTNGKYTVIQEKMVKHTNGDFTSDDSQRTY